MRTLMRELVIAKQQRDDEHDRDATLAYMTEAIHRQPKPKLKDWLSKRSGTQKQNTKQLRTTLQLISEAYRIPLRKKKR
jgi:hypothetical protein